MTSSINTNIAAFFAQANIAAASNQAASSVSRLSSGNRIVQASDDVTALAIGTSLGTGIAALKTAQTNASQGSSLLQVADGALGQIQAILQQQQSIANQAKSGSLTDVDRGFLNQQFQALSAEIDALARGTTFNGVQLLAGGLGTDTTLSGLDTLSAKFDPTAVTGSTTPGADASTTAIQAFSPLGVSLAGTGTAGNLDITDSTGTVLADGQYDNVNTALVGKFSSFKLSNVIYGGTVAANGSATITATINGVDFTGTYSGTTNTAVLLHNGNTYVDLYINAGDLDFSDAGTTATSQATLTSDFSQTIIERTSIVGGVDFSGTRLDGAIGGTDGVGLAATRLASANANITNFRYAGNTGAADTNELAVDVNGQTFTATGIKDAFAGASPDIAFQSQDGQVLIIDLTPSTFGGATTWTGGDFGNIRTNAGDQASLINALNQGFSHAGSGLNFQLGTTVDSNVNVNIASATSNSLFAGQTLSVSDAASATAASNGITTALNTVTALRSSVGSLESQFNFASAALQVGVQNQTAAQSSLLDTDIASESTNFATEQVKLQAGISVLAQANQQLQALLKLIG